MLLRTDCNYFAVRKNYYYVYMLEVVIYDYSTSSDIYFMEIEFEKYVNKMFLDKNILR